METNWEEIVGENASFLEDVLEEAYINSLIPLFEEIGYTYELVTLYKNGEVDTTTVAEKDLPKEQKTEDKLVVGLFQHHDLFEDGFRNINFYRDLTVAEQKQIKKQMAKANFVDGDEIKNMEKSEMEYNVASFITSQYATVLPKILEKWEEYVKWEEDESRGRADINNTAQYVLPF